MSVTVYFPPNLVGLKISDWRVENATDGQHFGKGRGEQGHTPNPSIAFGTLRTSGLGQAAGVDVVDEGLCGTKGSTR